MSRRVAVDFDGVLHAYSRGWQDGAIYDDLVPGALVGLAQLALLGCELVVFTSREDLQAVTDWLAARVPSDLNLTVTNRKPIAMAYIDDRAIRFTDWDSTVSQVRDLLEGRTSE